MAAVKWDSLEGVHLDQVECQLWSSRSPSHLTLLPTLVPSETLSTHKRYSSLWRVPVGYTCTPLPSQAPTFKYIDEDDPTASDLVLIIIYTSSGAALVILVVLMVVVVFCIATVYRVNKREKGKTFWQFSSLICLSTIFYNRFIKAEVSGRPLV